MKPGFALAPAFDTGILGDAQTTATTVQLIGLTSPNAKVSLQGTGLTTRADAIGKFLFSNLPLTSGNNSFTAIAQTRTGQSRFTGTITNVAADSEDAVLQWNATALRTLQVANAGGLSGSRTLAIVQAAVFDALNALVGNAAQNYRPVPALPTHVSTDAAVAGAAYEALVQLYPEQKSRLDTALDRSLLNIPDGLAETESLAWGKAIATALVAERSQDGSQTTVSYQPSIKPGKWRPTPPNFLPAAGAGWPQVTPFVLAQANQFRPGPPPKLTSQAYAQELNQVKRLGRIDSAFRTPEQTNIARFWIGSPGTSTSPGQWNEMAAQAAVKTGQTLWQNAQLLAQLNLALADAGIAAWDVKYKYRSWRPITAIRLAGTDGNPGTKADRDWQSFLETPAHPDYVSGHSTYAGAAAAVLSQQFGRSYAFSATSLDLPGIQRSYANFEAAAREAGKSRIYGGIHTQSANRAGLKLGHQVSNYVLQTALHLNPTSES